LQVIKEKAEKVTQGTEQRWKTRNKVQQGQNRQNNMFARLPSSSTRHGELTKGKIGRDACLLATISHSTRHGELTKEKNRQKLMFARHGE